MERQSFDNVWDALEDTPANAARMTMRSDLLIALRRRVKGWNLPPSEAARKLGISRTRLNQIMRGKMGEVSLDELVTLAQQAGLRVRIEIAEAA